MIILNPLVVNKLTDGKLRGGLMKAEQTNEHPYIYSESLQRVLEIEAEYFREVRNKSRILSKTLMEGFDHYTKMHALISAGVSPKALFGLFLGHKKELGYNIKFEIVDLRQHLYFSFKDFKWRVSADAEPDITLRAKFSNFAKRSFYIKYFGVIPSLIVLLDLLKGSVNIENKGKFFKLLLWSGSWFKGIFKSFLGCDVRLGVQGLTKEELIETSLCGLGEREKALILDAGCGAGNMTKKIKAKGYNVVGIDILGSELKKIREPEIPKIVADLMHLPFKSPAFSAVFLLDVIEHFSGEWGTRLLSELSRSLGKGGLLIISTPNPATPCQRILRKLERIPKDVSIIWPFHRREYAVPELKRLLVNQGFQIKNVMGRHDLDIPHSILLQPVRNHLRNVVRKFPSLSYGYVIIAVKGDR
jgi:SAM-dependent methyltransferase